MKAYRIVGRGGQGVITAGKILSQSILLSGEKSIMSEIHGLAQRGGGVVTDVKSGEAHSPTIREGTADFIISMDKNEALWNLKILKKDGLCITVSDIKEELRESSIDGITCIEINPELIHENVDRRSYNIFVLGIICALDDFPEKDNVLKAIDENFSEKVAAINREVFNMAYSFAMENVRGEKTEK